MHNRNCFGWYSLKCADKNEIVAKAGITTVNYPCLLQLRCTKDGQEERFFITTLEGYLFDCRKQFAIKYDIPEHSAGPESDTTLGDIIEAHYNSTGLEDVKIIWSWHLWPLLNLKRGEYMR